MDETTLNTDLGTRALWQQGWALYGKESYQEARGVLEQARAQSPDDVEVSYALALALKAIGDYNASLTIFQELLEQLSSVEDDTRRSILRRLAKGHINYLETGSWNLMKLD